jgi:hypothetical protein
MRFVEVIAIQVFILCVNVNQCSSNHTLVLIPLVLIVGGLFWCFFVPWLHALYFTVGVLHLTTQTYSYWSQSQINNEIWWLSICTLTHKINTCIIQLYVCVFMMSWLSNSVNVRGDCSFFVVDIGEIVDQHCFNSLFIIHFCFECWIAKHQ